MDLPVPLSVPEIVPGQSEIWGAVIIPTVVFVVFILMPWIGRTALGHVLNVTLTIGLLAGAAALTMTALSVDRRDRGYQVAVANAVAEGDRARLLAAAPAGIPAAGATAMLRDDPFLQGPRLFASHCAGCHRYNGHDGLGQIPSGEPSAADLHGFASRAWLTGLLDPERIDGPQYFGGTRFKEGRMVRFVKGDVAEFTVDQRRELLSVIAAVSAEAELTGQRELDLADAALIASGREAMTGEFMRCTECHKFHEHDDLPAGPDLTGYGSRAWLIEFIGEKLSRHCQMKTLPKASLASQTRRIMSASPVISGNSFRFSAHGTQTPGARRVGRGLANPGRSRSAAVGCGPRV
jgi:ubiquinol-cytochrome c reductase cytochrome b subunit